LSNSPAIFRLLPRNGKPWEESIGRLAKQTDKSTTNSPASAKKRKTLGRKHWPACKANGQINDEQSGFCQETENLGKKALAGLQSKRTNQRRTVRLLPRNGKLWEESIGRLAKQTDKSTTNSPAPPRNGKG